MLNGRISPALAKRLKAQERANTPEGFWDHVNTSGGIDACHPWTGRTQWNHPAGRGLKRYKRGEFTLTDCKTEIATRILCLLTFGRLPPDDVDTTPTCGDYMCCNIDHITITPRFTTAERKQAAGIPARQFFCDEAKAA